MKHIESGAVLCPLLTQSWAARLVAVLNGAQAMLGVRLDGTIIAASGQSLALLGRSPVALVGCARGAVHRRLLVSPRNADPAGAAHPAHPWPWGGQPPALQRRP